MGRRVLHPLIKHSPMPTALTIRAEDLDTSSVNSTSFLEWSNRASFFSSSVISLTATVVGPEEEVNVDFSQLFRLDFVDTVLRTSGTNAANCSSLGIGKNFSW